jgi:hypothetical protein
MPVRFHSIDGDNIDQLRHDIHLLYRRRDLIPRVKHIYLRNLGERDYSVEQDLRLLGDDIFTEFGIIIPGPKDFEFSHAIAFLLDLILSIATEVEEVNLHTTDIDELELGRFLRPDLILPELKTVILKSDELACFAEIQMLMFKAPKLEYLAIEGFDSCAFPDNAALPNLRNVTMNKSWFCFLELSNLIKTCPNLEVLEFELGKRPKTLRFNTFDHSGDSIVESLLPVKDTLKRLRIDVSLQELTDNLDEIKTVKPFTALESLVISGNCLYRDENDEDLIYNHNLLVDKLPPSIRYIEIGKDGQGANKARMFGSLISLAEAVSAGQFPYLETILYDGLDEYEGNIVSVACEAASIKFNSMRTRAYS